MYQKRTLYDIFKLRILLCFVVPIALAAVIIYANHMLNTQQYYEMYNKFYVNYTDEVFVNMDNEINTIVKLDYWLKNESIKRVFEKDNDISDVEARGVIQHMQKLRDDFDIIDSVLIVNRKADVVVATNGKATIDKYFGNIFKSNEYGAAYFKELRYPADTVIKLPPTAIGNDTDTRYVMPVIKMPPLGESPNSFFVFNISIDKLLGTNAISKYTDNTSFWFVNKKDKQFYSAGGNRLIIDEKIWDVIDFDSGMQRYEDNKGEKYYLFTKTVSPNLLDYAYIVLIPINDVQNAITSVTMKIAIISIIIYLLFAVTVMLIASNIGKSFAQLVKPFNFTEQVKMREVFKVTDKISVEISKLIEENDNINREMRSMMSDVKEKMITDVINNKNRAVKMSLYQYDTFLPIAFRIVPSKEMNGNVFSAIEEKLYSLMHSYFEEKYETFDIKNFSGEVHIVLNVPRSLERSDIENEVNMLSELVTKNEIGVKFVYHIGKMCDSFEKLRDEYIELIKNMGERAEQAPDRQYDNKYIYRASEHSAIINSILEGDYNKTIANIDTILITNVVNDVSGDDMKVLYQNIINTLITAVRMKKIDVDELIKSIGEDVYFDISERTESEISFFILELIQAIDGFGDGNSDEKLIRDVTAYIGENYGNYDITLESVAKEFGVDAKNLSRQFKKYNKITFHKYLTELRIETAKRLLITTDMSIESIYTEVGFVSRTTFMRAFNSVEKSTPSEYRKKAKE